MLKKDLLVPGVKVSQMEEGDLVYVDYNVWILPEDEGDEKILFETTDEAKAQEEEIFDEDAHYGPRVIELGRGNIMEGFEEDLLEAEVEEERSVEVPPEKAVGQRDAGKIELFSRRELERRGFDVTVGEEVNIDDRSGRIIQTTAGRVRVDFNHPLAGETLRFEYTVRSKAETTEEVVQAILDMDYGHADFEIDLEDDVLEVILPDECKYGQGWFVVKYQIVGDLRRHTEIKNIRFVEEYEGKKEPEEIDEEMAEELGEELEEELEGELEEEPEGESEAEEE